MAKKLTEVWIVHLARECGSTSYGDEYSEERWDLAAFKHEPTDAECDRLRAEAIAEQERLSDTEDGRDYDVSDPEEWVVYKGRLPLLP